MKLRKIVLVPGVMLLLAACTSISPQQAIVTDGTIQNSSLGFSGFTFEIPDGFEVYSPTAKNPADYNELQRMAVRIYELNKTWHPRDNERFYESFLLMSDQTCFLLITLKCDYVEPFGDSPFADRFVTHWQVMPLYNVTANRTVELGANRLPGIYTRGSAYEQEGWYYADPKRHGVPFNYEACKVTGSRRDNYILMGFSLPENAGALTGPMKQMMDGMKF